MQRSLVFLSVLALAITTRAQEADITMDDLLAEVAVHDGDVTRPRTGKAPAEGPGTNNWAPAVRLHAYPDPACDQVVINAGGELLRDVRVFDLEAREVIARRGLGIPAELLNVGQLPSGTYFVRVKTDTGVGTTRLIVQ
jgi:hypothetical protein